MRDFRPNPHNLNQHHAGRGRGGGGVGGSGGGGGGGVDRGGSGRGKQFQPPAPVESVPPRPPSPPRFFPEPAGAAVKSKTGALGVLTSPSGCLLPGG